MSLKPTHRATRPSRTCIALSGIGLFTAALSVLAAPLACAAAQDEHPAASAAAQPDHEPAIAESPFATFARLARGHWRLTLQSGSTMDTTWQPGPGGHSLRAVTKGHGGGGEPWRSLSVFYRHPQDERVRTIGVSSYARSVSAGTIEFDGRTAEAAFDLYQEASGTPGGVGIDRRPMGRRWEFDGDEKYSTTLWDTGDPPMGRWEHVRTQAPVTSPPREEDEVPQPSEHLSPLKLLLRHEWETISESAIGQTLHLSTTFKYVPYADYIYGRTVAPAEDGEPAHLLDTYIYHHTGTGKLSCLALSASGGVYEGVITVHEDGNVQCSLTGYEDDRAMPLVVIFAITEDGLPDRIELRKPTDPAIVFEAYRKEPTP